MHCQKAKEFNRNPSGYRLRIAHKYSFCDVFGIKYIVETKTLAN